MITIVFKATVVGAILGILAAHALFLGWWTLVPWGIAGFVLGYVYGEKSVVAGMAYGFVLVFVFLIGQYSGDRPLIGRLPAFALLAIFGTLCGVGLTTLGSFAKTYSR